MDRLSAEGYQTDKGPNYLAYYESFFAPHRHRALNLLELGVHLGGSLQMWRDYFSYGQIFGVDLNQVSLGDGSRVHTFVGDVCDPGVYERIAEETGVGAFDIIIDDASHIGVNVRASFEYLFANRLAPGGLYVIEDWGTAYMQHWPDGKAYGSNGSDEGGFSSHHAGVAGFVKTLTDHVARGDIEAGGGRITGYPIEFMTIAPGLVFLKKSG
jgi:cephalosporin hydroxylase